MTKLEIDIRTIKGLHDAELGYLASWAERQAQLEQFPTFASWLWEFAADESQRRTDEAAEPSMLSLPNDWSGQQLSDALLGSFILCRHPCTDAVAQFADELHLRCVVYCGSVLSQLETAQ